MAIESKMSRGPMSRSFGSVMVKRLGKWIWIGSFICLVLVGVTWSLIFNRSSSDDESPTAPGEIVISSGEYQAVFLDNGQVYFGKLERTKNGYHILTDVFYLQSGVMVDQNTNLSLTKLGSEAHGPEDRMEINPEHVIFIEDMKDDSKVVQAIKQYKSNK